MKINRRSADHIKAYLRGLDTVQFHANAIDKAIADIPNDAAARARKFVQLARAAHGEGTAERHLSEARVHAADAMRTSKSTKKQQQKEQGHPANKWIETAWRADPTLGAKLLAAGF